MKHWLWLFALSFLLGNTFAQSVWTPRNSGTTRDLWSVTWTGTQLVAVGGIGNYTNGEILTSPDGITWTSRNSGTTQTPHSVTWTGTQLVVLASNSIGDTAIFLTSPDGGLSWTPRKSGTLVIIWSVTWTGNQLVAVGGDIVLTSPDGISWTTRKSGATSTMRFISWINNQLVAVGDNMTIMTSPDGINWTTRNSNGSGGLNAVTWTGTQFVAVGNNATSGGLAPILTSPDGVTWTSRYSGTPDGLRTVTWTGSQLVAMGRTSMADSSVPGDTVTILTSPDGTTWTSRKNSGTSNPLESVVWTGSQLVAVGVHGTILTSLQDLSIPSAPALNTPTNGSLNVPISTSLTWNTSPGATSYRLQFSTDSLFSNLVVNDSTLTGTTKTGLTLANNTTYFWRVNAKNSTGTSTYSSIWKFSTAIPTPPAPICISPANSASVYSTTANLTWSASTGAASYRVQVSTNSGFTSTVVNDSTVTSTTRNFPYPNYGVYYWRVNAKNAGGTSAYSPTLSFTTSTISAISPSDLTGNRLTISKNNLRYSLPEKSLVQIRIFKSNGFLTKTLLNQVREKGSYDFNLPKEFLKTGYFLDFKSGTFHKVLPIQGG